jgi:hypothetical protein
VEVEGDSVVSTFDVTWNGGVFGVEYVTSVEWRCSQASTGHARITRDTAIVSVADTNAARLDLFFETTVYSALKQIAN